jgi:hypothetical protein
MAKKKEKVSRLSQKEAESLKLKEKICDVLMEEPHEFFVRYTKTVYGTATIMARDMEEAKDKFGDNDYDMEDDDEDIDFDEIEDGEE